MKHAREDYNRIQDPAGLIPDDEPVFLLRGQDQLAWIAVALYAAMVKAAYIDGEITDPEIVRLCEEQSLRMRQWHTHKMPDLTKERDNG